MRCTCVVLGIRCCRRRGARRAQSGLGWPLAPSPVRSPPRRSDQNPGPVGCMPQPRSRGRGTLRPGRPVGRSGGTRSDSRQERPWSRSARCPDVLAGSWTPRWPGCRLRHRSSPGPARLRRTAPGTGPGRLDGLLDPVVRVNGDLVRGSSGDGVNSLSSASLRGTRDRRGPVPRPAAGGAVERRTGCDCARTDCCPFVIPAADGHPSKPPQATAENVGEGTKKEQTLAHRTAPDEQNAPLPCSERHRTCSTARQRTVVPRSGRRGRRFKSCHPDHSRRSLTCGNAVP